MTRFSSIIQFPAVALLALAIPAQTAPVHTSYLWHLHQPIYYNTQRATAPDHYENAWDTIQAQNGGRPNPSDILANIFGLDDRKAAYQYRPRDSVQTILGQPDAGVQLNMSGALMENVQALAGNLGGYNNGWQNSFVQAHGWTTSGGKPRMDIVNFTYHHALAPLHSDKTVEMELRLHKRQMELKYGFSPLSKGYFPTEMAFSERLIPILKAQGIDWSIVSGNHLSRACSDFPLVLGSGGENCQPPNRADILNPAQGNYFRLQISRGCAPANAAPFAYTPHRAQYVNPDTGSVQTLIVVPSAMEYSWLDGYQCFGANQISDVAAHNNPARPELILLSHDGDNAFGGGFSYYLECVQNFVNGAAGLGYKPSTIEQYLISFPVPANDIVHVEDGAWVNADGDFGSPTYINWNYPLLNAAGQHDPVNGWHEKAREYAMFTAAENRVRTAEQVSGTTARLDEILNPTAGATLVERAWHYYLGALDSGNVYYGTPGDMEIRSTVGVNHAFNRADSVLGGFFTDLTTPTIWLPQRWPYNPGGVNFGVETGYIQKSFGPDFTVWTFVYDASGLASVTLKWRTDTDGVNSTATVFNETYGGGADVGAWQSIAMNRRLYPAGDIYNKPEIDYTVLPAHISDHCSAQITGQADKLIDYYVEAVDTQGNISRSSIQHVYVGTATGSGGGGGGSRATITPAAPAAGQTVFVQYNPVGGPIETAPAIRLHYGINNWGTVYSPDVLMTYNSTSQRWETTITIAANATKLDMVFHNSGAPATYDNNGGADWHFDVTAGAQPPWNIDGIAEEPDYKRVETTSGLTLWAAVDGTTLYVATQGAQGSGRDRYIMITDNLASTSAAPWAKAGTVVAWDAFLANEESNNFSGWFNAAQGQTLGAFTQKAAGGSSGVLEGTVDLQQLFGSVPATVYLAACEYSSPDAGTLFSATQAPATSNSNGNMDSTEYFAFSTAVPVSLSLIEAE